MVLMFASTMNSQMITMPQSDLFQMRPSDSPKIGNRNSSGGSKHRTWGISFPKTIRNSVNKLTDLWQRSDKIKINRNRFKGNFWIWFKRTSNTLNTPTNYRWVALQSIRVPVTVTVTGAGVIHECVLMSAYPPLNIVVTRICDVTACTPPDYMQNQPTWASQDARISLRYGRVRRGGKPAAAVSLRAA